MPAALRFVHAPAADYSDLASGQVLHSAPGYPAFPVRLALELFERARRLTGRARVGVWDPACGAGGIVTTVGLARGDAISHLLATDVSPAATALAVRSADRARAAERLLRRREGAPPISTHVAVADATSGADVDRLPLEAIDVVLADLPYGGQTAWTSASPSPSLELLRQLRRRLHDDAVIVLCSTRRDDLRGLPGRLQAFKHGTRHIAFHDARTGDDA